MHAGGAAACVTPPGTCVSAEQSASDGATPQHCSPVEFATLHLASGVSALACTGRGWAPGICRRARHQRRRAAGPMRRPPARCASRAAAPVARAAGASGGGRGKLTEAVVALCPSAGGPSGSLAACARLRPRAECVPWPWGPCNQAARSEKASQRPAGSRRGACARGARRGEVQARHVAERGPVQDLQHGARGAEGQLRQQLGREQEALRRAGRGRGLRQHREHAPLVGLVHALVDLVHHAERADGHVLRARGARA